MRENLVSLPCEPEVRPDAKTLLHVASEFRHAAFLARSSHAVPTVLCVLTFAVVTSARFTSGSSCLSLLVLHTSTSNWLQLRFYNAYKRSLEP